METVSKHVERAEEGPLRFSCFTSDEIKKGSSFKLKYSFGNLEHPIYGKAIELTGELEFLLQYGAFPVPNYFEMSQAEQDVILKNLIKRVRHLHEDLDDEEVQKKFLGFLFLGALNCPRLDARSPLFEVVIDLFTSAFAFDDLFEDNEKFPVETGTKFLYKKYPLFQSLISGNREAVREIGQGFPPSFAALTDAFLMSLNKIDVLVPSGTMEYSLRETFRTMEGSFLWAESTGEEFSEEGHRIIRMGDVAVGAIVEMLLNLHEICLPTFVRQSLLFQMFLDGLKYSAALLNDMMGLGRDMKQSATNASRLLRRVVREKISLQQAFDEEGKRLQNITQDMKICGKKLVEAFPDVKPVADFVKFCYEYWDGGIYAYILGSKLNNRYGTLHMEILPDKST